MSERRRRKKDKRRGHVAMPQFIPGVPALHEGGTIHNLTHPFGSPTPPPTGLGDMSPQQLADLQFAQGIAEGTPFNLQQLGSMNALFEAGLPSSIIGDWVQALLGTGGGGGGGRTGPTVAELDIQRERNRLEQRNQDLLAELTRERDAITIRGQDIDVQRAELDRELQQAIADQNDARIRELAAAQNALDQQRLAILEQELEIDRRANQLAQRGQDISLLIANSDQRVRVWESLVASAQSRNDFEFARSVEERMRLDQRQRTILDQHGAALATAEQGRLATGQAATVMGGLAASLGDIEARRAEFLSETAANPRDWPQLQLLLGGGESFVDRLAKGLPIAGQSGSRGGDIPALGADFSRLINAITARPDMPFFQQAAGMANRLGNMQFPQAPGLQQLLGQLGRLPSWLAPPPPPDINLTPPPLPMAQGGRVVTDEPIVGIGMRTGLPKFTLGEPTAEHPEGAPEMMTVTPLAHGGTVATQPDPRDALKMLLSGDQQSADDILRQWTGLTPHRPALTPPSPIGQPFLPPQPPPGGVPVFPGALPPSQGGPMPPDMITCGPIKDVPRPAPIMPPPTATPAVPAPPGGQVIPPGFATWADYVRWLQAGGPAEGFALPPPLTGAFGEHQISNDVALLLIGNARSAENALRQAESVGARGPHMDWLRQLVQTQQGMTQNTTAPAAPGGPAAVPPPSEDKPPSAESINAIIRQFAEGLDPRSFFNMLPSQREFLAGIVSFLGRPPEDFFEEVFRSFPTAPNPAQTLFASFSEGGEILALPAPRLAA